MAVTLCIDGIPSEIVSFANAHKGEKSLDQELTEYLRIGAEKCGMPRSKG